MPFKYFQFDGAYYLLIHSVNIGTKTMTLVVKEAILILL